MISLAGLLIDMLGVVLMFFNTPHPHPIPYLFEEEESNALVKKGIRQQKIIKIGFGCLLIGFALQAIGTYQSLNPNQ